MRSPRKENSRDTSAARIEALEAEIRRLRHRLRDLSDEAARNDSIFRKTQERELELLRAGSLAQLFERLIVGLKASHQLDAVALYLCDPEHEIRHVVSIDGIEPESVQAVHFVDSLDEVGPAFSRLQRPWLGPYQTDEHARILQASAEGSVALIPLRRSDQLDGVLLFGSLERRRFTPALASDFLAHLGIVAAVCIENAVNRARLLRSGLTDFLTGFHNRRYLHARLREELARAQRASHPVACLMIDVDHFKGINDRHGHLAGDAVLREVARRIDAQMRTSDTGARFGGDEFAIILPQGNAQDAAKVASRVLSSVLAQPLPIGHDLTCPVTLSIGVAAAAPSKELRDYNALAEHLLAEADAALYQAKSDGRGRVAVSSKLVTA
jgi:two-component system cell cycle response regulator